MQKIHTIDDVWKNIETEALHDPAFYHIYRARSRGIAGDAALLWELIRFLKDQNHALQNHLQEMALRSPGPTLVGAPLPVPLPELDRKKEG